MTTSIKQLYSAYQVENLTQISAKLIQAYKNKNEALIYEIANKCGISDELSINRIFSKIMQIYHPDKSQLILNELNSYVDRLDENALESYAHILKIEELLQNGIKTQITDVEFKSEEIWEASSNNDYQFYDEENEFSENDLDEEIHQPSSYNFYEAIQLREYGDLSKTFPSYYLEDIDEFELASSQIDSLEGAEFCKHAKIMDLSDNAISDLSELFELQELEELYLAHNELSYIDTLSNLTKLKILDLSFNQIDDISPLFSLENLEYVNLIGNPVSQTELELIKLKDIQIVY